MTSRRQIESNRRNAERGVIFLTILRATTRSFLGKPIVISMISEYAWKLLGARSTTRNG
jgi:hypothetical protein